MTRKQSQQHDAQRKPSWRVRWKTMSRAVGMEIREHKSSFAVYVVLRMLVLAMAILQFFNGDYENVFLCILTLLLLFRLFPGHPYLFLALFSRQSIRTCSQAIGKNGR